jgi:geranylgeranyl diphosphate synthase type II
MVGGQAIDLAAEGKKLTLAELTHMHRLKTGCLIRVSVEGAASIAGAKAHEIEALKNFGENLGLAFQVADDILDFHEKGQEGRSFVTLLGVTETQNLLKKISDDALMELRKVSAKASLLEHLIHFNQARQT